MTESAENDPALLITMTKGFTKTETSCFGFQVCHGERCFPGGSNKYWNTSISPKDKTLIGIPRVWDF